MHRGWIVGLREYYDPMYAFQREKKGARIEFSGEQGAVVEYLRERAAPARVIGWFSGPHCRQASYISLVFFRFVYISVAAVTAT